MSLWDSLFNHVGQPVAQILLTRNDIADVCELPLSPIMIRRVPPLICVCVCSEDAISERTKYLGRTSWYGRHTHRQRK